MDTAVEYVKEEKVATKRISIAREFSEFPAGRIPDDGPNSGQRFRDDFLVPALQEAIKSNGVVEVNLDDTMGYGSSFLDEAFGGLVREHGLSKDVIFDHLNLVDNRVIYGKLALRYIEEQQARVGK